MHKEDIIIDRVGKSTPYRVPDGYFEEVTVRIMHQLPAYPAPPKAAKLSTWQKMRPYVYMAAMFAGIWCMMKVFHTATTSQTPLDTPPESVMLALNDSETYDFFTATSDLSDYELEEEVSSMYTSIEDFEKDFYSI